MSESRLLSALALPPASRLDKRVAKKLLLEHCQPTASDRRLVQDGLEELLWVASLKPGNALLEAVADDALPYGEIAVLHAGLRPMAHVLRMSELIHRGIPYPVVLVVAVGETEALSLATKRTAQDGKRSVVLERTYLTEPIAVGKPTPAQEAFLGSLALARLGVRTLREAYASWIHRMTALEASDASSGFHPPDSPEAGAALREAVDTYQALGRELDALRAQANRERQLARRVELNVEIRRLEALREAAMRRKG